MHVIICLDIMVHCNSITVKLQSSVKWNNKSESMTSNFLLQFYQVCLFSSVCCLSTNTLTMCAAFFLKVSVNAQMFALKNEWKLSFKCLQFGYNNFKFLQIHQGCLKGLHVSK